MSKTIQLDLFQTVNIKLETKKIKRSINHNLISSENQEEELKIDSLNYVPI